MNVQELEAAVAARPHSPLFARLASEYLAAGRSAEAKDLCVRGLELYPDYLSAHLVLARILHLENNTQEALAHLAVILAAFPDAENVLQLKADWEQTLIESTPGATVPVVAAPAAETIAAPPDPDDAEFERRIVSKTLAEIYAQQGAIEEAILTYRLLRRARPERETECTQRILELESRLGEKSPANPLVQPELRIE